MKQVENKEIIVDSLNHYLDQDKNEYDNDMLFDEIFFLGVILRRYEGEVINEILVSIKERYKQIDYLLERSFEEGRTNLKNLSFYEQTQFIFNLIGYSFLTKRKDLKLTKYEKNIIIMSLGYSRNFDVMICYFIRNLDLDIAIDKSKMKSIPLNKEEEIYMYTHYFLMESKYFLKECKNDNICNLVDSYKYAIENNLGDLVAEIFWALNFFEYDNFSLLQELKDYLNDKYDKGEWSFSYKYKRQYIHSQYSAIVSFLELSKKRSE